MSTNDLVVGSNLVTSDATNNKQQAKANDARAVDESSGSSRAERGYERDDQKRCDDLCNP